ncbi:MAG: hypothetical protein ACI9G1_001970 [Pirellulaceae bacterium]|jgi:hypothetical protein
MTELMTAKYLQDVQIEEVPNPLLPNSQLPEGFAGDERSVAAKSPGALAWICTVLGGLGMLSALFTLPALLLAPTEMDTSQLQGQGAEAMILVAEHSMAIAQKFRVFNIALSVAHMIVAGGLLLGGFMTISGMKAGAQLLTWSCVLAIGFEVARFLLQGLQSYMQLSVIKDALVTSTEITSQMSKNLETGIMIGLVISLGFGFLFMTGKCLVYYLTTDRLQKPAVLAGLR